jgi:hypothetical protein
VITGMRPKLEELHMKFDNIIENIIKEAMAKKGDEETIEGFLSVLLRIKDCDDDLECPLTIDNIKAVILVSLRLYIFWFFFLLYLISSFCYVVVCITTMVIQNNNVKELLELRTITLI